MPRLLFALGAAVFWTLGQTFSFSRGTAGALMTLGELGNTSFVGLPVIAAWNLPSQAIDLIEVGLGHSNERP